MNRDQVIQWRDKLTCLECDISIPSSRVKVFVSIRFCPSSRVSLSGSGVFRGGKRPSCRSDKNPPFPTSISLSHISTSEMIKYKKSDDDGLGASQFPFIFESSRAEPFAPARFSLSKLSCRRENRQNWR